MQHDRICCNGQEINERCKETFLLSTGVLWNISETVYLMKPANCRNLYGKVASYLRFSLLFPSFWTLEVSRWKGDLVFISHITKHLYEPWIFNVNLNRANVLRLNNSGNNSFTFQYVCCCKFIKVNNQNVFH